MRDAVVQFFFEDWATSLRTVVSAAASSPVREIYSTSRLPGACCPCVRRSRTGAVDRAAAVQPSRDAVDQHLVEVVVAVPFEHVAGNVRIVLQAVDDARHAARQGDFAVRHAVAHGVAGAHLDGQSAFLGQEHQLLGKGQHEAVKVARVMSSKWQRGTMPCSSAALTMPRYLSMACARVRCIFLKMW